MFKIVEPAPGFCGTGCLMGALNTYRGNAYGPQDTYSVLSALKGRRAGPHDRAHTIEIADYLVSLGFEAKLFVSSRADAELFAKDADAYFRKHEVAAFQRLDVAEVQAAMRRLMASDRAVFVEHGGDIGAIAHGMKSAVADGAFVLIGVEQKALANGGMRSGGSDHICVCDGWSDGHFVIHDPGPKAAHDVRIPEAELLSAMRHPKGLEVLAAIRPAATGDAYRFSFLFQARRRDEGIECFVGSDTFLLECAASSADAFLAFYASRMGDAFSWWDVRAVLPDDRALAVLLSAGALVHRSNPAAEACNLLRTAYNPSPFTTRVGRSAGLSICGRRHVRSKEELAPLPGDWLGAASSTRMTWRSFLPERVPEREVEECLRIAYGNLRTVETGGWKIVHRTVPSGGAMYPLAIRYVEFGEGDAFRSARFDGVGLGGWINFDHGKSEFLSACVLANPSLDLERSSGLVVMFADMQEVSEKYGMKAAPLALLEAGHATQNLVLAASRTAVGTCELGGVREEELLRRFRLPKRRFAFMNAVLIGRIPCAS